MSEPQLCKLGDLQDGTYDICDLADMHEALDVIAYGKQVAAKEAGGK